MNPRGALQTMGMMDGWAVATSFPSLLYDLEILQQTSYAVNLAQARTSCCCIEQSRFHRQRSHKSFHLLRIEIQGERCYLPCWGPHLDVVEFYWIEMASENVSVLKVSSHRPCTKGMDWRLCSRRCDIEVVTMLSDKALWVVSGLSTSSISVY